MSTDDREDEHSPEFMEQPRRPYEKPAFKHERAFETMALACGKVASTQAGCPTALFSS